jgi:hypothetical protein
MLIERKKDNSNVTHKRNTVCKLFETKNFFLKPNKKKKKRFSSSAKMGVASSQPNQRELGRNAVQTQNTKHLIDPSSFKWLSCTHESKSVFL